jgi:hypothetical protein
MTVSPMLVPVPSITLAISGVISGQDNENGTWTTLEVCDPGSLGSSGAIQATGDGLDAPGVLP